MFPLKLQRWKGTVCACAVGWLGFSIAGHISLLVCGLVDFKGTQFQLPEHSP